METLARTSITGLIGGLTSDFKTFIRDEIRLAKTEISEKVDQVTKNGISVAVGGFVAYAGLIVLLIGLGFLISYFLQSAQLNPMLASFIGVGGMGLLVLIVGAIILMKGISGLKKGSLAPQRTMTTIQELRTGGVRVPQMESSRAEKKEPNSEEMQNRVEQTEAQMSEKLDELGYRLSPSHIQAQVKAKIEARPYSYSAVAMGLGFVSGLFLMRKARA